MNFNEETTKHINKVIEEKLPKMIEEKATKMVESIVEDVFRWGDTKDQIKKKIQESINVNLLEFDLIDYNALIAKTINENLLEQVNLKPIMDMTQDIVGFVNKKTITLEEIAELFKSAAMEENESDYEGEITFIVKQSEQYKWISVYADIEPDKEDSKCDFEFLFSTDGLREGQIFSFKIKDWHEKKAKTMTPAKMVALRGLEAQIFRLYSAQVKITNYDYNISNYWTREDY